MNYPNGKKQKLEQEKFVNEARRGMSLEDDINTTNSDYMLCDVAIIHKKPTPVTIVKVDYPVRSKARITEAYFKLPSTTDYNGIYKGKYIDFEAKECNSKTSFPFTSIHPHQVRHLESVIKHGAIAFLIIRMTLYEEDYYIEADKFINEYYRSSRKSITYEWIKENGHKLHYSYQRPCDYLQIIDKVIKL